MKKILAILFLLAGAATQAQTIVKNVDATAFKKFVDEKKGALIDLRTDDELQRKGKIPGAMQIDWFAKDSEAKIGKLDKKKTYLVYCAGGGRSGECAELMKSLGFKEVVNLQTGFDDWKRKGFPVENVAH